MLRLRQAAHHQILLTLETEQELELVLVTVRASESVREVLEVDLVLYLRPKVHWGMDC